MKSRWVIGIDEAGRGPLAGPVSVGVCAVQDGFNWDLIPGVDDSKKLSEKKREMIFNAALELKEEKSLAFAYALVPATMIDACGIVKAVEKAMSHALKKLEKELQLEKDSCIVKLDGSLCAPEEYSDQETIIGGDGKEKVIGLASIIAKVARDRYMVRLSKRKDLSMYLFDVHKGYGTKKHRELIKSHGLSIMHRKSFCMSLLH